MITTERREPLPKASPHVILAKAREELGWGEHGEGATGQGRGDMKKALAQGMKAGQLLSSVFIEYFSIGPAPFKLCRRI